MKLTLLTVFRLPSLRLILIYVCSFILFSGLEKNIENLIRRNLLWHEIKKRWAWQLYPKVVRRNKWSTKFLTQHFKTWTSSPPKLFSLVVFICVISSGSVELLYLYVHTDGRKCHLRWCTSACNCEIAENDFLIWFDK